jgi:hypothetical protein
MAFEAIRTLIGSGEYSPVRTSQTFDKLVTNNPRLFQKTFFPLTTYNTESEIKAYFKFSNGGLIPEFNGGPLASEAMNSGYMISQGMLEWRDSIFINERDLEDTFMPEDPRMRMAFSSMVAMAQQSIAERLNNRIEHMASSVIFTGGYTAPITGSITFPISKHFRLDLNNTESTGYTDVRDLPGDFDWTPALWSDHSASDPLVDLSNMIRFLEKISGRTITRIYMPSDVSHHITLNNNMWSRLNKTDSLAAGLRDINSIRNALTWIPEVVTYSGAYPVTTRLTAAASATATTIYVEDYSILDEDDVVIITNKSGKTVITTITAAVSSATITVDALTDAVEVGSVIEVRKQFLPDGHIAFEFSDGNKYQQMATLPSVYAGSFDTPVAGPYSIVDPSAQKSDAWVKVMGGAKIAPVVFRAGGFACARVTAATNPYL